jgi:hypothetical protein
MAARTHEREVVLRLRDDYRIAGIVAAAGLDGSVLSWDLRPATWVANACTIAGRNLTPQEWAAALPGRAYQRLCGVAR